MARIAAVVAEHYGDLVHEQRANGVAEESIAESLVETFDAEELAALIVYSATVHLRAALVAPARPGPRARSPRRDRVRRPRRIHGAQRRARLRAPR